MRMITCYFILGACSLVNISSNAFADTVTLKCEDFVVVVNYDNNTTRIPADGTNSQIMAAEISENAIDFTHQSTNQFDRTVSYHIDRKTGFMTYEMAGRQNYGARKLCQKVANENVF